MTGIDFQGMYTLAPRVRLQMDAVSGDPVLLYPEGIVVLNSTAHEIVGRFDGKVTLEEIIRQLAEEYEESGETIRQDVLETLADLQRRNLIAIRP